MITREQLVEWAQAHGWKLDRFGHLKKEFDNVNRPTSDCTPR